MVGKSTANSSLPEFKRNKATKLTTGDMYLSHKIQLTLEVVLELFPTPVFGKTGQSGCRTPISIPHNQ